VHIATNSRKTGGFYNFANSGGSKYFPRKYGGFLELTPQLRGSESLLTGKDYFY
jgi:hypothetical protein